MKRKVIPPWHCKNTNSCLVCTCIFFPTPIFSVSVYSGCILAFSKDFEIRTFEGCLNVIDVIKFLKKGNNNNNNSQQFLSACYMPGPVLHK